MFALLFISILFAKSKFLSFFVFCSPFAEFPQSLEVVLLEWRSSGFRSGRLGFPWGCTTPWKDLLVSFPMCEIENHACRTNFTRMQRGSNTILPEDKCRKWQFAQQI